MLASLNFLYDAGQYRLNLNTGIKMIYYDYFPARAALSLRVYRNASISVIAF